MEAKAPRVRKHRASPCHDQTVNASKGNLAFIAHECCLALDHVTMAQGPSAMNSNNLGMDPSLYYSGMGSVDGLHAGLSASQV